MARLLNTTWESAVSKIAFDRDLAHFLNRSQSQHLLDVSWRLARCADDHNIWFVCTADSGWLHGRFWKCRQKLCSYCLANESRRRRKSLREALNAYNGTLSKNQWRFFTLTIENPETSIATTRDIVNRSWSKLRKRACFALVRAYAKSEEFTLTAKGYHYHIHSLARFTERPNYQDWRRSWTECVESSGGKSQRLFGFDTIDGYLIIDFRQIADANNITNELCKYITKSTDFQKLSKPTLLELADTKRWHRMFELGGELRNQIPRPKRPENSKSSIVHTKRLSDGHRSDLRHFEEKRADQRYFAIDSLEKLFGRKVWSFQELATARRKGEIL